nr:hypothetical protein [Tanacetum cinerariifolium]
MVLLVWSCVGDDEDGVVRVAVAVEGGDSNSHQVSQASNSPEKNMPKSVKIKLSEWTHDSINDIVNAIVKMRIDFHDVSKETCQEHTISKDLICRENGIFDFDSTGQSSTNVGQRPHMIKENGVTITKKYEELSTTEKIQADCDLKETNIILQGLPSNVYSLVNDHKEGSMGNSSTTNARTMANISGTRWNNLGEQMVVKCLNCQREDPGVAKGPITQMVITHNAAYQADLDAYDFDCDEISIAKAVLIENLSSYGLDVLSEIPSFENTHNDMLNQSVQEMPYSEQTHLVNYSENEITNDSNIIPYSQYLLETQNAAVHDTNSFAQQDATILNRMYKLDPVTLAPKNNNNRETHIYYRKHTMEQTAILKEIVEQAKSLNPLDSTSYSAYKYVKLIQEMLGHVRDTCPNIHKPSEKLVAVMPINKKKIVREPSPLEVVAQEHVITKVNTRRPKHMTRDRSQLTTFVHKFLSTVKFGNDHIAKIMAYDLEVAFRKHTGFVRNLEGVDLLLRSRETNIYALSIRDMIVSSLICIASKVSKTISWLWHRRLSHLNFGAINHLAKNSLVRGLPELKFKKAHLCSVCAMGKSKKQSHKPKSEDTSQEKLYLLHMYLCGPMRVASVNAKKYFLVIVNDYSRFTLVKFLASKDEAPDFIIKFLKTIQVRLNATVKNIHTDNGTEFVNQTLRSYYESVCISHEYWLRDLHNKMVSLKGEIVLLLKNPDLSYLYVFGALCYPNNDSKNLGKLQAKVDIVLVANAPRVVDLADSRVSTSVDQDAPSTSIPSTQDQEHSLIMSHSFEELQKHHIFMMIHFKNLFMKT